MIEVLEESWGTEEGEEAAVVDMGAASPAGGVLSVKCMPSR